MGEYFKTLLRVLIMLLPLGLAACGGLNVEKVPLKDVSGTPEDAQPAPIGFREIRFAIPTGTPTVSQSPKGFFGILLCDWPYTMAQTGIRGRAFPDDNFKEIFLDTLKGQGYDVTGDPGRFFDETEDEMRTLYAIGGEITDIKIDTCKRSNFWGIDQGYNGEGMVEIRWSVFDLLNRKTVYKTTSKGYGKLRTPNYEGVQLLFEDAIAAAIYNLGADQEFHALVFRGVEPQSLSGGHTDPYEEPATKFDANEKVILQRSALYTAPAKGRLDDITKAVVLIQAGSGHGSGFFISEDGHMLTNAHVVGNASRVRVVTSGKEEKLVAEVLRVDRRRDVALLKLEEIPAGLSIRTLPVRFDKPEVGEDVYLVGAPEMTRLQDTVTSGIISAHRRDREMKQDLIQADVDAHGGNSGGPLLDDFGNVIGLSVAGYVRGDADVSGLNLFIPIGAALEALDIDLEKSSEKFGP